MKYAKLLVIIIIFIMAAVGCMNIQKFSLTEDSFSSAAKSPDIEKSGEDVNSYNEEDIDHQLYGRYFNTEFEPLTSRTKSSGSSLYLANYDTNLDITQMSSQELVSLFSFLSHPIEGAKVSSVNGQLPNAPRNYRNGVHEGLDYYSGGCGVSVTKKTAVLAAGPGTIIRADHDYEEMNRDEYNEAVQISHESSITPEDLLDKFRGKQVWIQHENGIVTRYAHLGSIESSIQIGIVVDKGQKIGTTGNSGTLDSVKNTGNGIHLHFEIWLNGVFLGKDRPISEVRDIYIQVLN